MVYTSQKLKVGRPLPQPSNAMWEKREGTNPEDQQDEGCAGGYEDD